jgi:two-component system, NarL family, sensor histidine kinase UhpB
MHREQSYTPAAAYCHKRKLLIEKTNLIRKSQLVQAQANNIPEESPKDNQPRDMKQPFLLFAIVLLFQSTGLAQKQEQASIDSLLTELKNAKEDTLKIRLLADIMNAYVYFKPQEGLNYQTEALRLAQKANFPIGAAKIKDKAGRLNWRMGNFAEALKDHVEALDIYTRAGDGHKNHVLVEIAQDYLEDRKYAPAKLYLQRALDSGRASGDKKTMADVYDILIFLYNDLGNTAEMTKAVYAYLKLCEQLGDNRKMIEIAHIWAHYYESLGNYSEAMKYSQQGLKVAQALGNRMEESNFDIYIGAQYLHLRNVFEAERYDFEGFRLAKEIGDAHLLGDVCLEMGHFYDATNTYNNAIHYYGIAEQQYSSIKDREDMAIAYYKIGFSYTNSRQFAKARQAFQHSRALYGQLNTKLLSMGEYFLGMNNLDKATGNWKGAYENYQYYTLIRDSAFNNETLQKLVASQLQYENEKKEAIAKTEQDKKDVLISAEISRQKIIRNFSIIGVIVILMLGVYLFYDLQRRKKLEGLQALSDERLRISRELHDDIGSTLGSIAVYSDVAKNRSQKNEDPGDVLSKIGTASRELIEKMSDIVWSLNPDKEIFEQLQNRMEAFAAMILTSRNISFEFKTDGELKPVMLTHKQRRNIFLIYKEALHNILKYAACQHVIVAISKSGNLLSLSVQDDGRGFDAIAFEEGRGNAYNGNGLKNIKARAMEMNASFGIASEIGKGTSIELQIKI